MNSVEIYVSHPCAPETKTVITSMRLCLGALPVHSAAMIQCCDQNHLRGGRVYFLLQFQITICRWEEARQEHKAGTSCYPTQPQPRNSGHSQRRYSRNHGECCLLAARWAKAQMAFLHSSGSPAEELDLPQWARPSLLYQFKIKIVLHVHDHRPIWARQFFSQGSPFRWLYTAFLDS